MVPENERKLKIHILRYYATLSKPSIKEACIYPVKIIYIYIYIYIYMYIGCPRRNGQNFGRVFLMLKYTDITQNTYVQS